MDENELFSSKNQSLLNFHGLLQYFIKNLATDTFSRPPENFGALLETLVCHFLRIPHLRSSFKTEILIFLRFLEKN
jgi:hypothetical protein